MIKTKKNTQKKARYSLVREAILSSLKKNEKPLSYFDIQKALEKKKIKANKTTIYREFNFLKNEDIISEVQYELASRDHHHHIICTECNSIKDFTSDDSEKIINKITKNVPGFAKITNHSFELFGLCKSCAKK